MKNIPKLRFPEFRDAPAWAEKKLGDLTKINQGLQIPISERYTEQVNNSYFYITNEFLKEESINRYFIKNPPESVICNKDDILMTRTGNTGQVVTNVHGAFHNNFFKIKYSSEINKDFLVYFLKLPKTQSLIMRYAGISTIPDLNHGDFYRLEIRLPNIKEQQKIAECLSSFDALILAQSSKVEALKAHKKALMQQLFPAEGETTPRLRFPEFKNAPEWEEMRLGELSEVRDGTHDSPKFYSSGRPLVTSKNLLTNGLIDITNVGYILEEDYEQINKRSRVDIGDILFGMIGTIGNPVLVQFDGFAIKNVALIKQKDDLLNKYLVHFLNSQYIFAKFNTLHTGNTQKFIALGQIRNLTLPIPKVQEQQKIADCLCSVDELITAQSAKVEALKQHKKALMQQLFPTCKVTS